MTSTSQNKNMGVSNTSVKNAKKALSIFNNKKLGTGEKCRQFKALLRKEVDEKLKHEGKHTDTDTDTYTNTNNYSSVITTKKPSNSKVVKLTNYQQRQLNNLKQKDSAFLNLEKLNLRTA